MYKTGCVDFFFVVVVNKCKWTKLSCCHPPPLSLPTPVFLLSVCLWNTHTYSLAQRRESVTMETRRRDSKSYLLRRELRQQKGVQCVSGRKATIYTAAIPLLPVNVLIKLLCQPFYLYPSVLFFCFFYLPSHVHVFSVYSSTCLSPALCLQLNACGSKNNMCVWLGV